MVKRGSGSDGGDGGSDGSAAWRNNENVEWAGGIFAWWNEGGEAMGRCWEFPAAQHGDTMSVPIGQG